MTKPEHKKTTFEIWKEILSRCIIGEEVISQHKTYELSNLVITLQQPHSDITTPIKILQSQFDWIYPDLTEIKQAILEKNNSPYYKYSYANRIFNYNQQDIDQLNTYIIPLLRKNPTTRRAILTLTNPIVEHDPQIEFFPGIVSIHFKVLHNVLHTTIIIRSCDLFLGWPANIYHAQCISEFVSEKLGFRVGKITTICLSAHVYEHMLPHIKQILKKKD
jgi:thymidylate synthase